MSVITNLNSNDDKKIQKLLEENLIKHDEAINDIERYRYKLIIDSIYGFERKNAEDSCKNIDKSIGFRYISEYYGNNSKCIDFFCYRMIDEILYFRENAEGLIHEYYPSLIQFLNGQPKCFLIGIISKYDSDLATYIKINMANMKVIDNFINIVKTNWKEYEEDKNDYTRLIAKLNDYYDQYGIECGCPRIDIYIYLFSKNGLINEFKKYYKMEDTTDEEFDELIKESDIYNYIKTINDINFISKMDKIIKDNINKKGKRLIF